MASRMKIPLGWDQQVLPKKPKSYLLGNHLLKRTQVLIPFRRAKIQKVSSLLIFLIVYGDHITEEYYQRTIKSTQGRKSWIGRTATRVED